MANKPSPKKTKVQAVKEALLRGEWVGPIEAFRLCGTLRFGAVIHTLKHRHGMDLVDRWRENENGVKWKEFRLRGGKSGPKRKKILGMF